MAATSRRRVLAVAATPDHFGSCSDRVGSGFIDEEAKGRFFASFDRTGSVTESAAEAGFNRNTAFGWARKAGHWDHGDGAQVGAPGRG
jgi:hypothetical protein